MTLDETATTEETQGTPEAAPSEQTQTEAAPAEPAEEKADATAGADDAQTEEQQKSEEKHRRKGGWQRQLEKLQRERDMLLEQLATQRQPQQPQAPGQEPTPEDKAAEYIDRLVEQRLAAREAEREQRARLAEFQRRTSEVRAALPDFDEVIASASDVPVTPVVREALLTSEHGPAIMYQLASNPAELARICALPPIDAAREIGRLEARASSTAAPKTAPKPAPRKPTTPAPITPVTARASTNVKPVEQMSYEEYSAWRASQRKR